ncbi:MAG TPA: DUF3108 domain-containing protein [bacterium]|nr:DUF3108 domain-containing protein [bacterium]HOL34915.1 DUF3108 domain-containing protein [bacterium]HPP08235.1 DUF3108 domain-containing protein [bacterium]
MKYKTISIILLVVLFISGCSEKRDVVIKKIENIPAENISEETIPMVVMTPAEKLEPICETKISIEKPAIKPVKDHEKSSSDTDLSECVWSQTETVETKTLEEKNTVITKAPQKKKIPEITVSKSPLLVVPGECLVFRIKWNFANVGKLILACKKEKIDNQEVYHFVGLTVPEGIWTKLGSGYNRFDSYIDSKTNLPFYYYQYSASSTTSQITKSIIDHRTKTLSYEVKKYKDGKQYGAKSGKVNFSGILFDGLSALYAIRGMAGDRMPSAKMPVGITKITGIYLFFVEKNIDTFIVGKREYWLIQSEATEDEAIFRKGRLFVSISADREKLPLLMKGKVPLGTGTVELISQKTLNANFLTDSKSLTEILNSTL